jgi:hypothetical protein
MTIVVGKQDDLFCELYSETITLYFDLIDDTEDLEWKIACGRLDDRPFLCILLQDRTLTLE